jgi:hypothetical protein
MEIEGKHYYFFLVIDFFAVGFTADFAIGFAIGFAVDVTTGFLTDVLRDVFLAGAVLMEETFTGGTGAVGSAISSSSSKASKSLPPPHHPHSHSNSSLLILATFLLKTKGRASNSKQHLIHTEARGIAITASRIIRTPCNT